MRFISIILFGSMLIISCNKSSVEVEGCDGILGSGKINDECGICDGNNTTCLGCDGILNSGVQNDECGVCGGSNDCPLRKVYVTNQSQDYVAVINAESGKLLKNIKVGLDGINCSNFNNNEIECEENGCEWMLMDDMQMCMGSGDNIGNTPHFISIDEVNGFWFVTLMDAGYIEQYSLIEDTLIDRIEVGDLPALSTLDVNANKLYVSRMNMPGMANMSAVTNIINVLSYSSNGLIDEGEIDICVGCDGIGPHAISLDKNHSQLYTASVLSDHIFKVDLNDNQISWQAMYDDADANPSTLIQKFKPIQCLSIDDYLFVSCSAGEWSIGNEQISGQIHMYQNENLEMINVFDGFDSNSTPWHIIAGNIETDKIYVTLSGTFLGSQGVACLSYSNSEIDLLWHNEDLNNVMDSPHGIALSYDESKVFVSDRGNGKLYIFDASNGELLSELNLAVESIGSSAVLGGVASTINLW